MKLSMWTICNYLQKDGFIVEPNISDGLPCISLVKQSRERTYSTQYAELLTSGKDVLLVNDMDTAVIRGADVSDVANSVVATLNFFSDWEHDIYDAMLRGAPLQDLLDIANKIFARPMFIKNDSTRTFAITRGYPADVHPFWAEIEGSMEKGVPTYDVVRAISADPEFNPVFHEKYPSIRYSPSYGNMVLHANIFMNDRRVAEIITLENNKPFNNGDIHLMNEFAELIEKYVSNNTSIFQSGSDVNVYLATLVETGKLEREQIQSICRYIGLDQDDEFCVVLISGIGRSDSPILSALREKLETQMKEAVVIPYKGQIVMLLGMKDTSYKEMIDHLKAHIPHEGFCWAVSYEFSGLVNMPAFYRQACEIMDKAVFKKDNYATMYDMAPALISHMCREAENAKAMVHPDLIRLENVDMRENTQYCMTLFYFLLCGGNFTDAAKIMVLHRNTLIYRMNKIGEIVHTNIDDIDNRKLLLYSYLILGKDY